MEKLRHCISNQSEALTSLRTNFLEPLLERVKLQPLKEVTLATHARVYRLQKLEQSAIEMMTTENALLEWMSTLNESQATPLRQIVTETLTIIEQVRILPKHTDSII